ncbi:DUF2188 domain-containing protein [bacterium]|nr:DUF2188 domain-containing protein [bacterium]
MSRKSHHIVYNSERGGWDIKCDNGQRSIKHFDKKVDAVKAGREISINSNTEFVIHGKDGRIQRSDSHGNDPCPPKDKK